jgi:Ni,Fe-hydrogenase maturation factor
VLGLGNEILADDAFGICEANEVERRFGRVAEVVAS